MKFILGFCLSAWFLFVFNASNGSDVFRYVCTAHGAGEDAGETVEIVDFLELLCAVSRLDDLLLALFGRFYHLHQPTSQTWPAVID